MEKIIILTLPKIGNFKLNGVNVKENDEILAKDFNKLVYAAPTDRPYHGLTNFSWKGKDMFSSNYSPENRIILVIYKPFCRNS